MIKWIVYGYRPSSSLTYNGEGGSKNIYAEFDDKESAKRYAKKLCEEGKADPVSVEVKHEANR